MTGSTLAGAGVLLFAAVSFAHTKSADSIPVALLPHESKPSALKVKLGDLLFYLDDPAFQPELKFTGEQLRRLCAVRQREWDLTYDTPWDERSANKGERAVARKDGFANTIPHGPILRPNW